MDIVTALCRISPFKQGGVGNTTCPALQDVKGSLADISHSLQGGPVTRTATETCQVVAQPAPSAAPLSFQCGRGIAGRPERQFASTAKPKHRAKGLFCSLNAPSFHFPERRPRSVQALHVSSAATWGQVGRRPVRIENSQAAGGEVATSQGAGIEKGPQGWSVFSKKPWALPRVFSFSFLFPPHFLKSAKKSSWEFPYFIFF